MTKALEVDAARQGGEKEIVAALAISLTAVVSGRRQIVFQTHVPQDADPTAVNAMLDRWGGVLDRQSAMGEIEDIQAELHKHRTALAHARADKDEIDKAKQHEAVGYGLEVETLISDQQKVRDDAYEAWTTSGRTADKGGFALRGAAKANHDRIGLTILELGRKVEAIKGERAAAESNFATTISRFEEEIRLLEGKERAKQALIDGG